MGAEVVILERSLTRIRELDGQFGGRAQVLFSDPDTLATELARADLMIGAVLLPGAHAPRLVTRAMLSGLRARAVIVDVAIDQGGFCENSRPTTHLDPSISSTTCCTTASRTCREPYR
jgi:alanine dehydrogenase